jgi:hypothetical protein
VVLLKVLPLNGVYRRGQSSTRGGTHNPIFEKKICIPEINAKTQRREGAKKKQKPIAAQLHAFIHDGHL